MTAVFVDKQRGREHFLWYQGEAARVYSDGYVFIVKSQLDAGVSFLQVVGDKVDEVLYMHNGSGLDAIKSLEELVKNDRGLRKVLEGRHSQYIASVKAGGWMCYVYREGCSVYDMLFPLKEDKLPRAVKEVVDAIPFLIEAVA